MFDMMVAGIPVRIHNRYPYVRSQCRRYMTDAEPVFEIEAAEQELEEEFRKTGGRFPVDICESTCICRKLCNEIIRKDAFLMHSAVVAVDRNAYAFAARSGVGKSTHVAFWLQNFGSRAFVVNGDKPLYRYQKTLEGEQLLVYGTPWCGKEMLGTPVGVPLKAICFLGRGEENRIWRVQPGEIITRLFHQVYLPEKKEHRDRMMKLLNRMVTETALYRMDCLPNRESAAAAYEMMSR